jgi:hypothetical protein
MGLGLLHNQAATVNECATGRFVFTFWKLKHYQEQMRRLTGSIPRFLVERLQVQAFLYLTGLEDCFAIKEFPVLPSVSNTRQCEVSRLVAGWCQQVACTETRVGKNKRRVKLQTPIRRSTVLGEIWGSHGGEYNSGAVSGTFVGRFQSSEKCTFIRLKRN